MRHALVKALCELAQQDRRLVLLTADLGFSVLEPFRDAFPNQYLNVGVSEQNMVGVATGLAESGYIPYVYSIAPFASLRPFEFIRNGPIAHQWPVRVIGIGGGFDYGSDGFTHYALEDIAVMRMQLGMDVIVPADAAQAYTALKVGFRSPRPGYYRIAKVASPLVPGLEGQFELGKAHILREGTDACFFVLGNLAGEVLAAAETLSSRGFEAGVILISSVSPPPVEGMVQALKGVPLAISVEAHLTEGGIGSLVAGTIADRGLNCRLIRCGIKTLTTGPTGDVDYLRKLHGLDRTSLSNVVSAALSSNELVAEAEIHNRD